jgi:hypothetical protein
MSNGETSNGSNVAMKPALANWIALYLVFCTLVSGYLIYSLWSLHCPKDAPCAVQSKAVANSGPQGQTPPPAQTSGQQAPASQPGTKANQQASGAAPQNPSGASASGGSTPPAQPAAQQPGQGSASTLPPNTGQPSTQNASSPNSPGQSQSQPSKNDPVYDWAWFGIGHKELSGETRLLLLVLLMGAFGSSVYSLKSLGDYRGDNKLMRSWALFYFVQPPEGSGIALLTYLVFRGGFLSGTSTNSDSVNIFGICAIAGLAGAFSDTAFMKLNEVFNTLFKPQDNRGGKIDDGATGAKTSVFAVSAPSLLPDGTVGKAYSVTLKADNGTGAQAWSVAPALPAGLSLGAATGVLSGTPSVAQATTSYTFTVKDSSTPPATATKSLSLTIRQQ